MSDADRTRTVRVLTKSIDEWKQDGRFSDEALSAALRRCLDHDTAETTVGTLEEDGEHVRGVLRIQQGTQV